MTRRPLTTRFVNSVKPSPGQRAEYFDTTVPGLALRVTEAGHKSWVVLYRTAPRHPTPGLLRRLTLGPLAKLDLATARRQAREALVDVGRGGDPAGAKRLARQGDTVDDLAKDYIAKHAKVHKRSWRDDDRMLEAEILPKWKHRKVRDLTRRDVRELVEAIAERGSPITANRCLALIRKMLNFAIERDWIEANVASLIAKPGTERSRDRVLTDDEIRLVWAAAGEERPAMAALTRLRLVTAQRGGELAQARWSDIDGAWLTLPPGVTKNKLAHRVPLSVLARRILETVPHVSDDWVFAGRSARAPLGDEKKAGRRIADRVLAKLQESDPGVTAFDFRGHDLRRTAATRMAEAGISQADISRVLNHAEGGPRATRVYQRYEGDREKQAALDVWSGELERILAGKRKAKVLPLRRRRRSR